MARRSCAATRARARSRPSAPASPSWRPATTSCCRSTRVAPAPTAAAGTRRTARRSCCATCPASAPDGTTPLSGDGGEVVAGSWFGQSSFATHSLATERNVVKVDDGPAAGAARPARLRPADRSRLGARGDAGPPGHEHRRVRHGRGGHRRRHGGPGRRLHDDHRRRPQRQPPAAGLASWARRTRSTAPTLTSPRRSSPLTGDGVQYTFDTTGVPSVILTAIGALRQTGVCGLVGRADRAVGDRAEPPRRRPRTSWGSSRATPSRRCSSPS